MGRRGGGPLAVQLPPIARATSATRAVFTGTLLGYLVGVGWSGVPAPCGHDDKYPSPSPHDLANEQSLCLRPERQLACWYITCIQ